MYLAHHKLKSIESRIICLGPKSAAATQTTTDARADIVSYNAQIIDKIVMLHNQTVDRVTAKENQYLPEVRHYDK